MTATARDSQIVIRRTLGDGDAAAIAELHRRLYVREFGMNEEFVARVAAGVREAVAGGWPRSGGAVWLVDSDGALSGSLALTDEGDGLGRLRWFALESRLRGHGLGRGMVAELLSTAREQRFERLELETFSALATAARIYLAAGFRPTWARVRTDWGPPITYQHYGLELSR